MRIAVGEFKQESNSFAYTPTTVAQFQDFHLWFGDDVITNMSNTNTEVGGFIDICREYQVEIMPLLAGFAISAAPLTTTTYHTLRDDLLARLAEAFPLAGVLLALHGAMVAEGEEDADGATLAAVRNLIGPDVPLVVSMDLHANITARCIANADAIIGFRTFPHVDQRETGQRAARLLVRTIQGHVLPTMAYVKLPLVTPASVQRHEIDGPFKRLMDACAAAETDTVVAASIFTVQPWLDIAEFGYASVVVTNNDTTTAACVAKELARRAWNERYALCDTHLVAVDRAIAEALAHPDGPVVLSDLADGTGAGSPGDATAVIVALLQANPDRPCLVWVFDPEVAAEAAALGVGAMIDTHVGGKRDSVFNQPVRVAGTVVYAQPASFTFGGPGYTGMAMDMGLSAVICCGQIFIVVSSKSVFTVDPALYRAVGLEPNTAQIVVVKSAAQFRAGYEKIAKAIFLLDTPGMSSDKLASMPFHRIARPMFPFDDCSFALDA